MSRRAQIILAPFLIVPLILLVVLGSLVLMSRPGVAGGGQGEARAGTAGEVPTSTPAAVIGTPVPAPPVAEELSQAFDEEDALLTTLYQDRSPAVVAIRVLGQAPDEDILQFPPARPDRTPEPGDEGAPEGQPGIGPIAEGSGFLIDGKGHIVTNNHVIEGAESIEVTFTEGSTIEATVVGSDFDSDLAVLKVDRIPDNVRPLQLGNSDEVKVGQRAVAIGNPFGLETTLTVGVVSARGRTMAVRETEGGRISLGDVIQTDAAINPGNSGGPLFNSSGEVIGVNTAIRSDTGTFMGVSFAVPSNVVKKVTSSLIEKGVYEHPYLGISMANAPITDAVAEELDLPVNHGVMVTAVSGDGPAGKAGLRGSEETVIVRGAQFTVGGDIIVRIDDEIVNTADDIIGYLVTHTVVGQTVVLTVYRDGAEMKIPVVLGARPTE